MIAYSELQREALAEVVNLAMGQAGDRLARLLGLFVQLSVPHVRFVARSNLRSALLDVLDHSESVTAVRQALTSRARGEALAVFSAEGPAAVADALSDASQPVSEEEALLDLTSMIVGACVGGIASQLGLEIGFSPPSILSRAVPAVDVLRWEQIPWDFALVVEVGFKVQERSFQCHLLVFWPEKSLLVVRDRLDAFLATL